MASDLGNRRDFHNEWTFGDGIQTLPERRLSPADVDDLVEAYKGGASISHLAADFGIHRTTFIAHLNRRGVPRHHEGTAWDNGDLEEAAKLYAAGQSLVDVADRFGIDPQTVANRFRRGEVPVRPRRGWSSRALAEKDSR